MVLSISRNVLRNESFYAGIKILEKIIRFLAKFESQLWCKFINRILSAAFELMIH